MRWSCLVGALIALCFQAHPARGQSVKEALQIIPEDAAGFLLVNSLEQANARIEALAKRLKAPVAGNPLALVQAAKGVNAKGSAAIAFFVGPKEDPTPIPVLCIPVTDYKTFLAQLEPEDAAADITPVTLRLGAKVERMIAAKKGSFALLTMAGKTRHLDRVLRSKMTVAAWAEPLQEWLSENEVSGVLTPMGLKAVTTLVREGLEEAKRGFFGLGPEETQFLGQWLDGLHSFIKSVDTDVTHVAAAAKVDAAGNLQFSLRTLFAKGSDFAKTGAASKPLPGGPLTGVPGGPFAVALGGSLGEGVLQSLMNFNLQMLKAMAKDVPRAKMRKLEQAYAQMSKGLRGMGFVIQVGKEGDALFRNVIAVVHVDNAAEYLENFEKGMIAMNELIKELALPLLPAQEIRKVKVDGVTAVEATTDLTAGMPLPDEQKAMFEKMFGPGGKMTVSQAALDDKTVIMRYAPAADLKELLGAKGKGLAADPEIAKTAALLPEGSQWALYVHPQGAIQLANRLIRAFAPMPVAMPDFPKSPPVGIGVKLSESGLEIRVVIPGPVVDGIGMMLI